MTWEWVAPVLGAAVALGGAYWSSVSAIRSQRAEHEAARLRDLSARNSERYFETVKPLLDSLNLLLTPGRQNQALGALDQVLPNFMTYIGVFGSDETVRTFQRFRSAHHGGQDVPVPIVMRLIADFLVALRADMAVPGTQLTGEHVLGMRITDLYDNDSIGPETFSKPFAQLAADHGWRPPWSAAA